MKASAGVSLDILEELDLSEEDIDERVNKVMEDVAEGSLEGLYQDSTQEFKEDTIIDGEVIDIHDDEAVIDIGYKSEGIVPLEEFEDEENVEVGEEYEVLLESVSNQGGMLQISHEKGREIRAWEHIIESKEEGDIVEGKVVRQVKGGLLVDIGGITVFLPASQVDIRKVPDIGVFIGEEVKCKILKIDDERMNIIVSRRRLIEEKRERQKKKLLEEIEPGQVREGVVKNIVDFGVFVELGGVDGLLHITDMSWGRVENPRDEVELDEKITVKVLDVDEERERIALGLKQLHDNPWENIKQKYPVGSRVEARVVNILPYGAFLEIEKGLEGLLHISEMSWTERVNHPSKVVSIGDVMEVVILSVNEEKEEISLGLKQTERNPWNVAKEKYPPGTRIEGSVRNLTSYGAFIEVEKNIDGLLHVSDVSWTRNISDPSAVFQKGEQVEAIILSINPDTQRVSLGKKQLEENPWETWIPKNYSKGTRIQGSITKLTNFGAFINLEEDLDGLLHVSKIAVQNVGVPSDVFDEGDEVEVEVLRLQPDEGKISLSLVDVIESDTFPEDMTPNSSPEAEEIEETPEKPEEPEPVPDYGDEIEPSERPEPMSEMEDALDALQNKIRERDREEKRRQRMDEKQELEEEEEEKEEEKEEEEEEEQTETVEDTPAGEEEASEPADDAGAEVEADDATEEEDDPTEPDEEPDEVEADVADEEEAEAADDTGEEEDEDADEVEAETGEEEDEDADEAEAIDEDEPAEAAEEEEDDEDLTEEEEEDENEVEAEENEEEDDDDDEAEATAEADEDDTGEVDGDDQEEDSPEDEDEKQSAD